jgi:hypothetical protein
MKTPNRFNHILEAKQVTASILIQLLESVIRNIIAKANKRIIRVTALEISQDFPQNTSNTCVSAWIQISIIGLSKYDSAAESHNSPV